MPTETLICWVVKKLFPKSVAEKMCPENIIGEGTCWKCRAKIPFMIPRRGYSNSCGVCSGCGSVFTMLSNYGLVTLFPVGVVKDYMDDVRSRANFNTTEKEDLKNLLLNFFTHFYTSFAKTRLKTASFSCIGGFWGSNGNFPKIR